MKDRKAYWKQYHREHREREQAYRASRNERRLKVDLEARRMLKLELIHHYSKGAMRCPCGFGDIRALTIDHIDGGGVAHAKVVGYGINFYRWLKKNGYPKGYQVLCMNCQFLKRYKGNKYVAHLWNKK